MCRQFSRFGLQPQRDLRDSALVHLSGSSPCVSPVLPFRPAASTGSSRFCPCPLIWFLAVCVASSPVSACSLNGIFEILPLSTYLVPRRVCRQFSRFGLQPQRDLRDSALVHLSGSSPCVSPVLPFRPAASTGSSRFCPCPLIWFLAVCVASSPVSACSLNGIFEILAFCCPRKFATFDLYCCHVIRVQLTLFVVRSFLIASLIIRSNGFYYSITYVNGYRVGNLAEPYQDSKLTFSVSLTQILLIRQHFFTE